MRRRRPLEPAIFVPAFGRALWTVGKVVFWSSFALTVILVLLLVGDDDTWPGITARALLRPFLYGILFGIGMWLGGRGLVHFQPRTFARIPRRAWLAIPAAALVLALVVILRWPTPWQGGAWQHQTTPSDSWLVSIDGTPDGSVLYACGLNGVLLRSTDRGTTWERLRVPATDHLRHVVVSPDGTRIWAWQSGQYESGLVRSTDGGTTWTRTPVEHAERVGHFGATPGGRILWLHAGEHGLLVSTDGGDRWSPRSLPRGEKHASLEWMSDDGKTLIGTAWRSRVIRSADGGRTWTGERYDDFSMFTLNQNGALYGVHGVRGARDLWLVGHMEIAHSDDGGRTWDHQPASRWPEALAGSADGSVLWAVGHRGTILYSSTKGRRWDRQPSPTDENLNDVFVTADGREAWAVGGDATILHVRR